MDLERIKSQCGLAYHKTYTKLRNADNYIYLFVAVPIPKSKSVLNSMGKELRFPVSILMAVQDQVSEPAVER